MMDTKKFQFSAGGWSRDDNGETVFVADMPDYSPVVEAEKYDRRCSGCYFGFAHSVNLHQKDLATYEPGTCPRCHIGSQSTCSCPHKVAA